MSIYTAKIALALRLITKYGGPVTVTSQSAPVPDGSKPWLTTASPAVATSTVAAFIGYGQQYIDGVTIQQADQQAYLPAQNLGSVDLLSSTITKGGAVWRVISIIETFSPADEIVAYLVQVRR